MSEEMETSAAWAERQETEPFQAEQRKRICKQCGNVIEGPEGACTPCTVCGFFEGCG